VGPNVLDRAGNQMNQNQNSMFGEAGDAPGGDRFSGTFLIQGLAVNSITVPNPLLASTGSAIINFNMPVNPATFTLAQDIQLLDPNGNPVPLTDGGGNPLPGVVFKDNNPGTDTIWE